MYAQLGDIVFQALKGFTSFEDEKETTYARHALIESKPRLQRTGETLQEINFVLKLHAAFCNPEVEYDALDTYRQNGDILPLILGSGFYENDFVITKLKKILTQTDDEGNYIDINVEVTLVENYDPDKIITRQQRAKLDAFAVDVERPLPAPAPKVDNTLSAQLYKYQQQIRNDVFKINQKISAAQADINQYLGLPNAVINMGQQFVNIANKLQADILPMSARVTHNITLMATLLTNSSALFAINPALQSTLTGYSGAASAMSASLTPFSSLPNNISNATQGNYVLGIFNNAKNATDDLNTNNDSMFSDFSLYAAFIVMRRKRL